MSSGARSMSTQPSPSTQLADPAAEQREPEQQLARTLGLCEAQMESALSDSDVAVDALVKAFTSLAESTRVITAMAENLPPEAKALLGDALQQQVENLARQTATSIIAFQFYDKLTQRLGHVRYSLSTLAMFVCDRSQTADPNQWERLLKTLRRLYRTDEERQIFQMVIDGKPLDETAPDNDSTCEVELF